MAFESQNASLGSDRRCGLSEVIEPIAHDRLDLLQVRWAWDLDDPVVPTADRRWCQVGETDLEVDRRCTIGGIDLNVVHGRRCEHGRLLFRCSKRVRAEVRRHPPRR